MWGAESAYNYISGVPSPSKFVYQYPLYTCGYGTEDRIFELRSAIQAFRPLIVDTSSTNLRVPPIRRSLRETIRELQEECALAPDMEALLVELEEGYVAVGTLPHTGWQVYRPRGSGSQGGISLTGDQPPRSWSRGAHMPITPAAAHAPSPRGHPHGGERDERRI
jgi:hypothetical protein